MTGNILTLDNFDINSLPSLDVAVLGALELFQQQAVPEIDISNYKRPLIVGSGNAEATGRIVFDKIDAVFASESNFESKLKNIPSIDGVVIISASGEKHAPIIAKVARDMGKPVTLITNSADSTTSREFAGSQSFHEHVFPKNREPYTYNTSTYMGMILGATKENPAEIEQFINDTISHLDFPDFAKYDKYFLMVPTEFSGIIQMLQIKFKELFGRNIAREVETSESVKHAATIAKSNELFISFGEENTIWGDPENRFFVPMPSNAGYVAMMAIGYFTIAQIQNTYPHLFKDNIVDYIEEVSKIFGQQLSPIVDK